jgi:hypothetical protein
MGDYELYHASTRKHKYIKKIGNRYFYTQQEIQAYLNGKKESFPLEYKKSEYTDNLTGEKMTAHTIRKKKANKYGILEGVTVAKGKHTIEVSNGFNRKSEKENDGMPMTSRRGRVNNLYYEDGSIHTIDLRSKKEYKKTQAEDEKTRRDYDEVYVNHDKEFKKKRKRAKKKIDKATKNAVSSMKKQSAKGKKALDRWNKKRAPRVTVVQSISEDKNYKRQNGQRG